MLFVNFCNFLNSKIFSFLFISLAYCNSAYAVHLLPLPHDCSSAVSHEYVKQLDDWSCGYNVLFNAACLEHRFGLNQNNADSASFKAVCLPYINKLGKLPQRSSDNTMLEHLAHQLGLQPFTFVILNDQQNLKALFSESVRISFKKGSSQAIKQKLFKAAFEKRTRSRFDYLRKHLDDPKVNCSIIHFACHVRSRNTKQCYNDFYCKKWSYKARIY